MLTDQAKALLNVSTANRWRTQNIGNLLKDSLVEIAAASAAQDEEERHNLEMIEDKDRQITALEQRIQHLQGKHDTLREQLHPLGQPSRDLELGELGDSYDELGTEEPTDG